MRKIEELDEYIKNFHAPSFNDKEDTSFTSLMEREHINVHEEDGSIRFGVHRALKVRQYNSNESTDNLLISLADYANGGKSAPILRANFVNGNFLVLELKEEIIPRVFYLTADKYFTFKKDSVYMPSPEMGVKFIGITRSGRDSDKREKVHTVKFYAYKNVEFDSNGMYNGFTYTTHPNVGGWGHDITGSGVVCMGTLRERSTIEGVCITDMLNLFDAVSLFSPHRAATLTKRSDLSVRIDVNLTAMSNILNKKFEGKKQYAEIYNDLEVFE